MFSVLMSLYNKEEPQNLWECLESIKSQTLQADEIVIVYDGFVNDSLNAIVESFKDVLNIKVLPLKKNVGLGRALQKGLEYCQHEIVARMDTDDICQPNRFEKQINFILENQDVDMLGTSIIEFDEENNQRLKALPENNEEIRKFSIWKNP